MGVVGGSFLFLMASFPSGSSNVSQMPVLTSTVCIFGGEE